MIIKVEDDKDLVRDSSNGAILNTNRKALDEYRRNRNHKITLQSQVNMLESKVKQLEDLINTIIENSK